MCHDCFRSHCLPLTESSYRTTWTAEAAAVAAGYMVDGGGGVAAAGPCRAGVADDGIAFPAAL